MTSGGGKGEKILVSVRVRPRNDKEKTRNDICDWECVNNTTIICNNNLPERSLFPSTYTFGNMLKANLNHFRVKNAKKPIKKSLLQTKCLDLIAPQNKSMKMEPRRLLFVSSRESIVATNNLTNDLICSCLNEFSLTNLVLAASIFAYGQTSSGKTYTMSGITKFAMNDIFCYIQKV